MTECLVSEDNLNGRGTYLKWFGSIASYREDHLNSKYHLNYNSEFDDLNVCVLAVLRLKYNKSYLLLECLDLGRVSKECPVSHHLSYLNTGLQESALDSLISIKCGGSWDREQLVFVS